MQRLSRQGAAIDLKPGGRRNGDAAGRNQRPLQHQMVGLQDKGAGGDGLSRGDLDQIVLADIVEEDLSTGLVRHRSLRPEGWLRPIDETITPRQSGRKRKHCHDCTLPRRVSAIPARRGRGNKAWPRFITVPRPLDNLKWMTKIERVPIARLQGWK